MIDAVAAAAERAGFATLWAGERVVGADHADTDTDWLDPFITLSFAAAATTTIGLSAGVVLPARNPVLTAKQAASLDKMSGGRLTLCVHIGRCSSELAALGVPFEHRVERAAEYVEAMRALWRDETATFHGEFVSFDGIRVNPKPRSRHIPVLLGGTSESALQRAAASADGWYGSDLDDVEEAAVCASALRRLTRTAGRDPGDLRLSVALRNPAPTDVARLADAGIDEMVLVATPPGDPIEAEAWVGDLARQWMWVLN